ncbi:MAG: PEP/pyruvate-binding domain-containing protein, partial [Desulfatirhabdiaceae bacterium]
PRQPLYFAVRSSAWGEDGFHSFAGQYQTFLNIPADRLLDCYRRVLASAFSPEAISYRLQKGFQIQEQAMSAGCQVMVDAVVSGVIYTLDTLSNTHDTLLITATWGLGAPVVDGSTQADQYSVTRLPPHQITGFTAVQKSLMMTADKAGETQMVPVPESMQQKSCLTSDQVQKLAETSLQIERYFKRPQDIEWAIEPSGKIIILQARPLNIRPQPGCVTGTVVPDMTDHPVLFKDRGIVVQRGVAAGPVFVIHTHADLAKVPAGVILVTRHTSPRIARVMRNVHGILTDVGSPTGHMATIAREFRVPTIVNTGIATQLLKTGDSITLDASQNRVYAGHVTNLCHDEITSEEVFEESYEYRLLRRILRKISPLHLLNPHDKNFSASGCKTVHDIIRFIHEQAVTELIHLGESRSGVSDAVARPFRFAIPLGLVIIDIGGGIEARNTSGRDVRPEDIISTPMQPFLEGLLTSGMWNTNPMSVDFGSFMSSLTRTFSASSAGARDMKRNLAVVSAEYLNLHLRLGYHFNMIDAYISEKPNDNYAYFRFLGGVTDITRRSRRARFIGEVLEQFNFRVEIRG